MGKTMTHLCVPIFVTELGKARRAVATAAEAGADMVELRIDKLTDDSVLPVLLKEKLLPVIVTCRPVTEGGFSELGAGDRARQLIVAADHLADYVDIELQTLRELDLKSRSTIETLNLLTHTRLIVSSHDFSGRPEKLYNIVRDLKDR